MLKITSVPDITIDGMIRNRNNSMNGLIAIKVSNWTKTDTVPLIASIGDWRMNLVVVSWVN